MCGTVRLPSDGAKDNGVPRREDFTRDCVTPSTPQSPHQPFNLRDLEVWSTTAIAPHLVYLETLSDPRPLRMVVEVGSSASATVPEFLPAALETLCLTIPWGALNKCREIAPDKRTFSGPAKALDVKNTPFACSCLRPEPRAAAPSSTVLALPFS